MEMTYAKTGSYDTILKEICYSNGIKYNKLCQEGLSCLNLELYFTGFYKICGLENFPNLQHLCVVGQPIQCIENLNTLTKLHELWIVECDVQEIVGLENCRNLKKLFLYTNNIFKIQNLEGLTFLTVLHLNNNQLRIIEGLDELVNLKELNLAENFIEHIGTSLNKLIQLETLELSGNPIFYLQDPKNLVELKHLSSLCFKSCLYKSCPLTHLFNYSFYMVYHLPALRNLDEESVELPSIKSTAEIVVEKKMRYYRMKRQLVQRHLYEAMHKIDNGYLERIHPLLKDISNLKASLRLSEEAKNVSIEDDISISKSYQKLKKHEKTKDDLLEEFQERAQAKLGYLQVELSTMGNVIITIGNSSYPWFNTCLKLVTSRFCGSDCPNQSGSGIWVTRIARIDNLITTRRFNFHVNSSLHPGDGSYWPTSSSNSTSKNSDYLFHIWHGDVRVDEELMEILSQGMKPGICQLSNSIQIANAARLPAKRGRLVLCRVFLGKTVPYRGNLSPAERHFTEGADSMFQTLQLHHEKSMEILKDLLPHNQNESKSLASSQMLVSLCSCTDKQLYWFIREAAHVCPEYVVEFEYINSKSELPISLEERLQEFSSRPLEENFCKIDLFNETEYQIPCSFRDLCLSCHDATCLDLSFKNLMNVEGISQFNNLVELVIAHNSLTTLEGMSSLMLLKKLDVSHNKLHSLECLMELPSLETLDINFNNLSSTYYNLLILKERVPNLLDLNFCFNPWRRMKRMKVTAVQIFPLLKTIDGESINAFEESGKRKVVCCSCEGSKTRGLNLIGWTCTKACKAEHEPGSVTRINMSDNLLIDLSDLVHFNGLEMVILDNNNIISLEGLSNSWETLTYLSLANNHLSDVSCLSLALNLTHLNLDFNNLECIRTHTFEDHLQLQVISVIGNELESLEFLTPVGSLVEFYASDNSIQNTREVFVMKKMTSLAIVDLHGNPMSNEENYRLFTIFHLRCIKILDGEFIDQSEVLSAKELFGGLLTLDFLADQLNTISFSTIKVLDLPQFSLQTIDLGNPSLFSNLISINLEHNNLTSFCGLTHLSKLKTLCLNYNHIEGLHKAKNKKLPSFGSAPNLQSYKDLILPSLEVLHLGYNGIRDLTALHFCLFPSLKALFLQGNDIVLLNGLEGCTSLEELVLDRNRIRYINDSSFQDLTKLTELHLEENRLRSLSNFGYLQGLQRLFLGMNHLQEICDIDKLSPLTRMVEISLVQNNLAKRNTHRLVLIHHLPNLQIIDGSSVTDGDRSRAEIYFQEQIQFNSSLSHLNSEGANLIATGTNQSKHGSTSGRSIVGGRLVDTPSYERKFVGGEGDE